MPEIALHSGQLRYEWRGKPDADLPVAVFLHDGLGAIDSWKELPEMLCEAAGVRALIYDRLGYGRSEPQDAFPFGFMEDEVPVLVELLDQLGIGRANLIGHSDGGSIALLCAAWHPQRVQSLVTVAAHTFVEPETRASIRALLDARDTGRVPRWLERLHGDRADALLRAWGERWLTAEHAAWNIQPELPTVECPVLVIQGENDEFGTDLQVKSILEAIGPSEGWIVPGAGHTPYATVPDEFVERLAAFLKRHGRAR